MQVKKRAMDREPRLRVQAKTTEFWLYWGIVIGYLTCYAHGTTTPSPVPCTAPSVSNANYLPTGPSFNSGEETTYTCDTGYLHTAGNLTLTCQANGTWIGTTPTCTIVTCATDSIANADKAPTTPSINYSATVTYSCQTGYEHASGDASRTCQANGSLSGAQPSCNIISCNARDVLYAAKTPATPSVDYNMIVSYTCDYGYELASGDINRTCQADGSLSGTQPICTIKTCNASDVMYTSKTPATPSIDFNTTVSYTCNIGYELASGDVNRICQADGSLSGTQPTCTMVTCNASDILYAAKTPATPSITYNSTVTYACDIGYDLAGGDVYRTCQADGSLSGTQPTCIIIKCNASDVLYASYAPVTPNIDYNMIVSYTCDYGYELASGDGNRTCQADGSLNGTQPTCIIIQCTTPIVPFTSRAPSDAACDLNKTVIYTCITGYNYTSGDLSRTCLIDKTWSGVDAVCTIVTCAEPANVSLATKSPIQASYDYNTSVTYTCDTGYKLDTGTLVRTCTASGLWSGTEPSCTNITCPAPAAVANSNMTPIAGIYLYNDNIAYTCITGYELTSGNLNRTCGASGAFSGSAPVCSIKQCNQIAAGNATMSPDTAMYNYATNVTYTCDLAWVHTAGDLVRTCDANGSWTGTLPTCTVDACLPSSTITDGYFDVTQTTYPFGHVLNYYCNAGYYMSAGDANRTCQTSGLWDNTLPTCSLVRCNTPPAVSFSSHTPVSTLHDYGTNIEYACDLAYNHTSGDLTRTCQQNFTFTGDAPVCTRVACIQEPSTYMTTNPDKTLHNFNDVIEYACILGYNHSSGDLFRTCLPDGNWNGTKPECVIITCDTPTAPPHSSIAPLAAFVNYNTNITYTCDLGYNRTGGDASRRCTEFTTFEGTEANCTLVTCDPPTNIINGTYLPLQAEYDYNSTVSYTCNFGYYHFSGDLNLTCDENAAWVVTEPVCMVVQCASPIGPSMEIYPVGPTMYDFNTTINATCDLGYNLTGGDDIRTCLHTGFWDGSQAVCTIIECSPPDSVNNSTMDLIKNPYVYGDAITYTCVTGYELTSGNATRSCTETQAWTGTAPICTIIHCPIPPNGVYNTYAPALVDYIYLDAVTYTCDYGYNYTSTLMDSTCLADKTWSFDPAPVCTIITCDIIDVPHMGFTPISTTTLDFNTTATYFCDIGYNHTFGDLERTCNVTGEWTNILPNCTIIECPAPATVAYSSLAMNMTKYVYQDTITYACVTGYEMLIGDASRTCTETTDWNGTAPVCTIIHCPIPADGTDNTYAPVLGDYVYNDMVNYTCDTGYIHTSGDLSSICLPDKTWSATPPPVCEIVKCAKIDVPNATFTPPTATTHDFNTTIVYSCDIGYNHTYGDLVRTCNESAMWKGLLPVCTLITCDPPAPILYTYYNPNLAEHDWNTDIDYSCDADYHYISGINKTTCNESGAFPPVDLNCSVQHTMTLSSSEPYLTWINSTVNTMDTVFDFDGICDVTIQCTPPATFDITHTISGTQLTMTVTENVGTVFNEYYCSLIPYQGVRTFALVNRTVFYGEQILGLQARVVHDSLYLAVGRQYHFETNVTDGTDVTIIWSLDASSTQTYVYDGDFTYMDLNHTFLSPTENVTVYANNFVTPNVSYTIEVYVIYAINMATLTVNSNLRSTTENAHFILSFDSTTLLPLANVDITVSLLNGSGPFHYTEDMQSSVPGSFPYAYDCTYPTQGQYNVTAVITNPVDTVELYQVIEIWDHLSNISIFCHTNCTILVTNTSIVFEFTGVPVSGFEYSIYMGDGHIEQNANDSILYVPYALSTFSHIYTYPGYFNVHWNVSNYGRSHSGNQWVTIQNKITNFKAWLNNTSIYLVIGTPYHFEASADFGTNVTITWDFPTAKQDFYLGEFTYVDFMYTIPSTHTNVTVTASNLVSSASVIIQLFAIYTLNGYSFAVDNTVKTTTEFATFDIDFLASTQIPLATVKGTIDFKNGSAPTVFMNDLQIAIPGTFPQTYTVIYPVQGYYNVTLMLDNPVDSVLLFKYMEIWDRLDTVVITCHTNCSILVTNTVMVFEFTGVPVSGFEYSTDMDDATVYANADDSILYLPYALPNFTHTYTLPGYYHLQWNVSNYGYSNQGNQWVTVQNLITNFKARLNNTNIYLVIGTPYQFEASADFGTNVTITWDFPAAKQDFFLGEFTYVDFMYSFPSPQTNVTVTVSNLVSSASVIIQLFAIYTLNGYSFAVDNTVKTTTEFATFDIDFLASTQIPLATVKGTIDFKNGSAPTVFMNDLQIAIPGTFPQTYTVIYPVQGYYNVTLMLDNPVDSVLLFKYMEIWDRLDTVVITCHTNCSILVTNTVMVFEFTGVPVSGFEYSTDMDDATVYANADDSILYLPYALPNITHTYTLPGYYHLQWNVSNYGYSNQGNQWVTVQNVITNFKAWLNNANIYLVIGTPYQFEASADFGTNVTITWDFPAAKQDFFLGEFTYVDFMYTFPSPQTNVTVTVSNLVSSASVIIQLFAIYTLNGYSFAVDNTVKTTTEFATFDIDFLASTQIPLATVKGTIDFKNGSAPTVFMNDLQIAIPGTFPQTYTVIYPVQGYYNVTLMLDNPVDSVLLFKYMEIWDRLDTVVITCHTNCSILVTNTVMVFEFTGVPVSGFEYSTDMDDATVYANADDSILYLPYALPNFTHTYTLPGYYYLQWSVSNYGYSNQGNQWVTVQNLITNFEAWLDNSQIYLEIGQAYPFGANATQGTNVTLTWGMGAPVIQPFVGEFTSTSLMHTFNSAQWNVTVTATNLVSSSSVMIHLIAVYSLNGHTFTVDNELKGTTEYAHFEIDFKNTANIPLANVEGFITFYDGGTPSYFVYDLHNVIPAALPQTYDHIYLTQGYYTVRMNLSNPVSSVVMTKNMRIWDDLTNVKLDCKSNCPILITNTSAVVEFANASRSGFEYTIDMDAVNGTFSSDGQAIYYDLYNLTSFSSQYTSPGIYRVIWNIKNKEYKGIGGQIVLTVQNVITDFQAFSLHSSQYMQVGKRYNFFANGTGGTNVTIEWIMQDTDTVTRSFNNEFSAASLTSYKFSGPKKNVTVVAWNLVSNFTIILVVEVFYEVNRVSFLIDDNLGNTTSPMPFYFKLNNDVKVPMRICNITILFSYGLNTTDSLLIDDFATGGTTYTYPHLFDMQGQFVVTARMENVFGHMSFPLTVRIWDSLLPLEFVFINPIKQKYIITNTVGQFKFINTPNYGFEYSIDFGDGTPKVTSVSDSILYSLCSLSVFTHTYTTDGVYTVTWKAYNGENSYDREEKIQIHVQNRIPFMPTDYAIEPYQKKYPWINLQTQSISINITLNPSVLIPTNATCTFDADDGTTIVENLVYDGRFFEHTHDYLNEGYFNSTLNCSNDVSNYVYNYEVEVRKCLATDISLVYHNYVPLNVSDNVTVYFHIDNGGFALIPYNVYFSIDYGDNVTSDVLLYDVTTYDHYYTARGNYSLTLKVNANVSQTNATSDYSLRLGLMYFEYNTTVQFINTTVQNYHMYGIRGLANYTIDFDDTTIEETCTSTNQAPCDIFHYCPTWGYHFVEVVGTNGSFIELDNVNITCDNPIKNLTVGDASNVTIPNGTVDAKLILTPGDLFLPNLTCTWNMGDPIKLGTYGPMSQRVTHWKPFNFTFQYIALGRHTITIECYNLINSTRIVTKITVSNKDFVFLGVFDRFYSQRHSPLPISAMLDTEIFSRLDVKADYLTKTHTNLWKPGIDVLEPIPNRHNLEFARGTTDPGIHEVILEVCFVQEPTNCIFEPTFVRIIVPPPHAEIVGGRRRYVNRGIINVDARTLSYNPAHLDDILTFSFKCVRYNAITTDKFADALQNYEAGSLTSDCEVTTPSLGQLQVNTNSNPKKSHYIIEVTVNNNYNGASRFIQVLAINTDESLTLICKINCLSKVAVSSKLQLISDLTTNCQVTYKWTLHKYGTNQYDVPITLNDDVSEEGDNGRSLTILPHTFQPATWYLISLTITGGGQTYGPAYHEFVTNQPPRDGWCRISQYNNTNYLEMPKELQNTTAFPDTIVNVKAVTEYYNCTCLGWEDEGFTNNTFSTEQPLFYTFYVSYSSTVPIRRQIVYFDPGATSNLVAFQAGDEADNYTATVVLRITDVLGDYTEVKYLIRSEPELLFEDLILLSNDAQYTHIRSYFDQFDDELIKANGSWDYRTIARRVMDMASIYNKFGLLGDNENMNSTDGVVLSPDDLLSLGYQKTENNEAMTWSDYWKLIVEAVDTRSSDYIAILGEDTANMLHSAVSTWPDTKRMTLISIDTIARALNASMTKRELTNVTEAVYGAKTCSNMSNHLKNISNDRTFPNTEHLEEVVQILSDLLRNILASLSAVLTPNFPQDPSVDEMRNYLEFIEVFKTTDGAQPLSLQEQTFLAQKQLQKYYVQKYIKEEASKEALSYITNALQVLTYVLGKMTHSAQKERLLENDYFYISVEIPPANMNIGLDVKRPRVALKLKNLIQNNPMSCNSSVVQIRSVIFKSNPYFWGQFGDRITSYVPIFEIEGASVEKNAQLQFRLENKVEPKCIDKQPTYDEDDPNKMIYILFYRQHPEDDILIFLRPNASELVYKLYFNKDDKPDIIEDKYTYSTTMNKNDDTWTVGDGYKLLIKSSEYSETGKIWIGLQPLLDNSQDWSLTTRKFCANVTSVNCLAWMKQSDGKNMWVKDHCQVSRSSTLKETICTCPNPGNTSDVIVGTTFYVPHNIVDFKTLEETIFIFGRAPVIAILIAVVSVYVLLISWAWREDIKDQYKWSYSLLQDNDIADSNFYIMRVYTGLRSGAGTSSKIGFVLVGDDGDTNVRLMDDDSHIGFDSGSVRTFVMSTRRHLGDIVCLRIWHNDTGSQNSSWYLNKITVTDMTSGKRYSFPANKWFDYDSGDTKVDRVLNAQEYKDVHGCQEMAAYTIAEHHMWLSVLLRPMRSNFSRVQRLSCLLSMIYLTMIILTLIIRTSDQIPEEEAGRSHVVVGPFRFSMENAISAFIAVAGASLVMLVVSFFFRNSESEDGYPNLDSMLRRVYRKVNDKLHIDKSVVGRRYWSPAEDAIEYTHFFLPHFCVYIAWSLLAVSLIVATYLVCTLSVDWQLIKSEEWMTAICVSFFASFIGVEGVKIIILLVVYALFCRRGYQVPDPNINNCELEEITRYNSATLNIGPNHEDVLDKPENPDDETLLKNKIDRIRSHQLLKIFMQLLFFSGVLYLVYTISYETRDPRSFYLKNHVEKKLAFDKVTDLQSYTEWLETTFIEMYFQNTFYGAPYADHDMKIYMEDLANVRVGPARLRQHRVKPDECVGPLKYIFHTCHDNYDEKRKETSDYCLKWHNFPCPVAQKSEYFTSDAWLYVSPDEVWGFPTLASYGTYGGGGYFMKLDVNKDVCGEIFQELVKNSWFDVQTRSVILEFTLYNANTNLFIYSKFVAEFPEVGGFIPFTDMQVFRLYASSGPEGEKTVFMQFIFLLVVLLATLHCVYQLATDAKAYLKVFWNILDMVALVMSYTTISIFIYKLFIIEKTIETFHEDKNAYVGFENLAFYDFIANTAFGVLVFLLSVRVSRILGYSGKINEMAAVISHAASDLYGFLLIFGITYLSYVFFGTLLFGKDTVEYKDVFQTYGTLTEAVIGKNRVANILTSKPIWAEFFYFTFVLFVLMTLATMAAAILNFSISVVKQEQKEMSPTNIVEVIFEKIASLFRSLVPKKRDDADKMKPRERKDSDAELKDILTDLSNFMKELTTNNKPGDKYKLTPDNDNPA